MTVEEIEAILAALELLGERVTVLRHRAVERATDVSHGGRRLFASTHLLRLLFRPIRSQFRVASLKAAREEVLAYALNSSLSGEQLRMQ